MPEATLPPKYVYYDDLDTVRFADSVPAREKPARSVTALGTVMTGLLIGDVAPVLSRAQSCDCEPLLALTTPVAERAAQDDRLAFLKLVRRGYIEVTLPEGAPAADAPDGKRYTVLNGFRSWVADRGFVFSGWPELNGNPDLRQEILGSLASPDGRPSADLPDHVAARIDGLRELDGALNQSPAGIRVVRTAAQPLSGRIAAAALPAAIGGLGVSFASSLLTGAGVEQAAAASALAGVITIVAGTPAVRAFSERREARLKNRRTTTDYRGAVRTGAAAWLDRLKRQQ